MRILVTQKSKAGFPVARAAVECPPARRLVNTTYGVYRLRTPYTVFYGYYGPMTRMFRVFWRPQPVTRADDTLHKTWFTNVHSFGQVCLGPEERYAGGPPADPAAATVELAEKFWSSQFNFDVAGQLNPSLSTKAADYYRAWQNWDGPLDTPVCDRLECYFAHNDNTHDTTYVTLQ